MTYGAETWTLTLRGAGCRGGAGGALAGRGAAVAGSRAPSPAASARESVPAVSAVSSAVSEVVPDPAHSATSRVAACGRARPGGARRCADPMRRQPPRHTPLLLALALACLLRSLPSRLSPIQMNIISIRWCETRRVAITWQISVMTDVSCAAGCGM
ncbi:hypothetical protein B5X24_HaOG215522 [Helicoverpa armigera]|nr:hypothetical protein B5X24_HaOG215522 [Helicoverpa armigera]